MTLPPDFWTRPQPGGAAGLGIGFAVAVALSFYLLSAARKRFGPGRMSRWQRIGVTVSIKLTVAFCVIAGAVIFSLIFLAAGQRDFWTGIAIGVAGLLIVLGALVVRRSQ